MTDAAEAARAPNGPTAAWARSSDLRFYATSTFLALDLVLVVLMLRAREEPEIPPERPRPSQRVYDLGAPRAVTRAQPDGPDPLTAPFTLDLALAGIPGTGALTASIETSRGTLRCALDTARAPRGVATFVGLARGTRPFWDGVAGRWSRAPFYDASVFFRVVPGARIEGGGSSRTAWGALGFEVPQGPARPTARSPYHTPTCTPTQQV